MWSETLFGVLFVVTFCLVNLNAYLTTLLLCASTTYFAVITLTIILLLYTSYVNQIEVCLMCAHVTFIMKKCVVLIVATEITSMAVQAETMEHQAGTMIVDEVPMICLHPESMVSLLSGFYANTNH